MTHTCIILSHIQSFLKIICLKLMQIAFTIDDYKSIVQGNIRLFVGEDLLTYNDQVISYR